MPGSVIPPSPRVQWSLAPLCLSSSLCFAPCACDSARCGLCPPPPCGCQLPPPVAPPRPPVVVPRPPVVVIRPCLPACLPACMPTSYLPACLPACLPAAGVREDGKAPVLAHLNLLNFRDKPQRQLFRVKIWATFGHPAPMCGVFQLNLRVKSPLTWNCY